MIKLPKIPHDVCDEYVNCRARAIALAYTCPDDMTCLDLRNQLIEEFGRDVVAGAWVDFNLWAGP